MDSKQWSDKLITRFLICIFISSATKGLMRVIIIAFPQAGENIFKFGLLLSMFLTIDHIPVYIRWTVHVIWQELEILWIKQIHCNLLSICIKDEEECNYKCSVHSRIWHEGVMGPFGLKSGGHFEKKWWVISSSPA